jgi:archaetidylinositol phosphate synthase
MPEVEKHERIHNMLLGPLERPALRWLSAHLPRWMDPDALTFIGILGSMITLVGYYLTNFASGFLWLASFGFIVNWFGDSLDGTVARFRGIERPKYGYFVDHTVDAFSQVLVFAGLGLSAYVRLEIACLALVGYLLISILTYIDAFVSGEFRISYAKIGPTEMRLIAIIANTVFFFIGNRVVTLKIVTVTVFELIVAIIAIVLIGAFFVCTFIRACYWRSVEMGKSGE